MPGLIRGVARTAVIAGTATHVSNNVSRRQAGRWAEKEQAQQPQQYQQEVQYVQAPPPPPVPQAPPVDLVGELTKLSALKDAGALSDAEFEVAKSKLLNS